LNEEESESLKFVSKNLADGKRPHELMILKCLMHSKSFSIDKISDILKDRYGLDNQIKSIESAINLLNLDFFTDKEKSRYINTRFFNENFGISKGFERCLKNPTYRKHLEDVISFALVRYEDMYHSGSELKLYQKYSRKDVCRLLNWPHDDSSTMYGYRVKHNTVPIFVTYEKDEGISESTKYEDRFLTKETFSWMTRSRVKLTSKEAQAIINCKKTNLGMFLFVKKSDDEGRDFYYMGEVEPVGQKETTINDDKGRELPIVNFTLRLETPVKDELYSYFVRD
jgi:hypothetical protein